MEQSRRRFFQHKDKHYPLTVDYFSSDLEICLVSKDVNSSQTILQLKRIFSRHGIPDISFIDNGPQFDSRDFTNFSTDWQSQHITSSPRQHKSNGEVKRAVQTMKTVFNKSDLKAEGTVFKQHESPRSVVIQTLNGQVGRNRRMA